MILLGVHRVTGICLWRKLIARAMAVVILFTMVMPPHAFAAHSLSEATSAPITASAEGADDPLDRPADVGLVQHVHCCCHAVAQPPAYAATVTGKRSGCVYAIQAEAFPLLRPASLPFKPPRALTPQA